MKKIIAGLAAIVIGTGLSIGYAWANNNAGEDSGLRLGVSVGLGDHGDRDEAHKNGTTLEIHLNDNGTVLVRGAKVTAVSGSTINASTTFGSTSLAWVINTDSNTRFARKFGGVSAVSEVSVGDLISVTGSLDMTAATLTVKASTLKDWSIQKQNAAVSGTVASIDASAKTFVVTASEKGNITVSVSDGTVFLKNDTASATFADLSVGSRVKVSGVLDLNTHVIAANKVMILMVSEKTTFEGTLKAVSGTTLPATLTITVGGVDYTVNVASDTSILSSLWGRSSLTNFRVGDNIRVYGSVNGTTINATVIRDTSIRI